jgi:hypothetical protein
MYSSRSVSLNGCLLNPSLTLHKLQVVPGKIDFVRGVDIPPLRKVTDRSSCAAVQIYLRFDFQNRCNCGFAFVNFVSKEALLEFAKARLGLKW